VGTGNTFTGSKSSFGAEVSNEQTCIFVSIHGVHRSIFTFFPPRLKTFLNSVEKKGLFLCFYVGTMYFV
jgi:hypothetical protein